MTYNGNFIKYISTFYAKYVNICLYYITRVSQIYNS